MKQLNLETGKYGESRAITYLTENSYTILEKNFKSIVGEIDVICKHKEFIVFIEVKTRTFKFQEHPAEAITPWKQRQIIKTALCYIQEKKLWNNFFRFDVISILFKNGKLEISHIENAFEADGYGF